MPAGLRVLLDTGPAIPPTRLLYSSNFKLLELAVPLARVSPAGRDGAGSPGNGHGGRAAGVDSLPRPRRLVCAAAMTGSVTGGPGRALVAGAEALHHDRSYWDHDAGPLSLSSDCTGAGPVRWSESNHHPDRGKLLEIRIRVRVARATGPINTAEASESESRVQPGL